MAGLQVGAYSKLRLFPVFLPAKGCQIEEIRSATCRFGPAAVAGISVKNFVTLAEKTADPVESLSALGYDLKPLRGNCSRRAAIDGRSKKSPCISFCK